MLVIALFAYAVVVSVMLPVGFMTLGPVRERRALLGVTYLAVVILGWCAALALGFLSPYAAGGAAAVLATLGLILGGYTLRDELLLARIDRRIGAPSTRSEALAELRGRIVEIGNEGEHVVALMEIAGFPLRRLLLRGLYDDALELLEFIDESLGTRLGQDDIGEAKLLRARTYLHLGRVDEAAALLEQSEERHAIYPEEAHVLRALIRAAQDRPEDAERELSRTSVGRWATWSHPVYLLASAHVAASRGDAERASTYLGEIPTHAHDAMWQLARTLPGPATELANRLARPSSPYR